jgi:hypothetical protein
LWLLGLAVVIVAFLLPEMSLSEEAAKAQSQSCLMLSNAQYQGAYHLFDGVERSCLFDKNA